MSQTQSQHRQRGQTLERYLKSKNYERIINPANHSAVVICQYLSHALANTQVCTCTYSVSHETTGPIPVLVQISSNGRPRWNQSETQEDKWADRSSYEMILGENVVGDEGQFLQKQEYARCMQVTTQSVMKPDVLQLTGSRKHKKVPRARWSRRQTLCRLQFGICTGFGNAVGLKDEFTTSQG